jgi:hypothetical protein
MRMSVVWPKAIFNVFCPFDVNMAFGQKARVATNSWGAAPGYGGARPSAKHGTMAAGISQHDDEGMADFLPVASPPQNAQRLSQ